MTNHFDSSFVNTNGIRLHTIQAGPADGKPVILLHGFPEFWRGWQKQIYPLANDGYRVIVPDQRGYNLSDKPKGIGAYRLNELIRDVVGLIRASGHEKAAVVGHDWGGVVAWWLAIHYPHRLSRMGVLNAPHPSIMAKNLLTNPSQILRSTYALFFQIPGLPEAIARYNDWQIVVEGLEKSSRPGTFTDEDFEYYRQAWWRKNAFTSMLNWYRAGARRTAHMPRDPRVRVPTLVLWGAEDVALGRELVQPSVDLCDNGRLTMFEDATHWVQHEEVEAVTNTLLDFLG